MIWASVNQVFFIGISSFILPRKLYLRIPLTTGRIAESILSTPPSMIGNLPRITCLRYSHRQIKSSDREIPYQRAVSKPCRQQRKLSSTIRNLSSSDQ